MSGPQFKYCFVVYPWYIGMILLPACDNARINVWRVPSEGFPDGPSQNEPEFYMLGISFLQIDGYIVAREICSVLAVHQFIYFSCIK